jgi:DNA polymerase-4
MAPQRKNDPPAPYPARTVLHLDMDAFFAAVEILDNPSLAGKPVIVGGTPEGRGVVTTASYEARRFGVHSAMSAAQAVNLCPAGVFLPPRMGRYAAVSKAVFAALREFSPAVEPVSIDEAFVDLTGTGRLLGPPAAAARAIKERIRKATGGLSASVGIGPNKFLAKVASDLEKPDGLVVLDPSKVLEFLAPLPVEKLWGVGPRTAEVLHSMGLRRIGDLQRYPEEELRRRLGQDSGRHLALLSRGIDDRPVEPGGLALSVSSETTFGRFIPCRELASIDRTLLSLSEDVAARLRALPARARRVVLKVRDERFATRTRSRALLTPTRLAEELFDCARSLYRERVELGTLQVRLLGVAAADLLWGEEVQLDLFDEGRRGRAARVAEAVDRIRDKLGEDAVQRASLLPRLDGPPEKRQ